LGSNGTALLNVADEFFFGNQIGTLAIELGDKVDFTNIGFHGGWTFAVQFESGNSTKGGLT
jgi:hypothetical protein